MNILVCGARGFIGAHIALALERAGHCVVRGVSSNAQEGELLVDYARDTDVSTWLPRLQDIDGVVNVVGVLRDTRKRPMQAVHTDTPKALFDACAQKGIRRVVQISALGIASSDSRYATTKRAADEYLQQLTATGALDGVVVRPSVVFGLGGESSALFVGLSKLPVLLLPNEVIQTRAQPIAVAELAACVMALCVGVQHAQTGIVECAGSESLTIAAFIASLRLQAGLPSARVWAIPDWLTQLSAKVGDALPISPWGTDALSLLASDNVTESNVAEQLMARAPMHYSQLLRTYQGH